MENKCYTAAGGVSTRRPRCAVALAMQQSGMKYRYLGSSGIVVSEVCLGTMTFGNAEWGCDQPTATAITRAFLNAGGNFIDTADIYNGGRSEEMTGAALRGVPRDEFVLATKAYFPMGTGPNARGLSRKHLVEACEASLRRLGLDYIDLYQIHGPDPNTPIAETMAGLDHLVRTGKVLEVGCSNLYAWQIVKANAAARAHGYRPFVAAQHLYNLVRRDIEREILPAVADEGMSMICWSPLASGLLTGKYHGQDQPADDSRFGMQRDKYLPRFWHQDSLDAVAELVAAAKELGRPPSHLALAWLLTDDRVTAPIVGARTVDQITQNLAMADWEMPDELYRRLTAAMPFALGYPKDWMDENAGPVFERADRPAPRAERLP